MDSENHPPEPSNVIKLDLQHTEPIINKTSLEEYYISGEYFLSNRYSYFAEFNDITVYDLFLGIQHVLVPKTDIDLIQMSNYIHLSTNRGFIVYKNRIEDSPFTHITDPTYISIVSIDFKERTYELIDNRLLEFEEANWQSASHPSSDIVMFESFHETETRERQFKLNICKFNASFSKIEYHESIDIQDDYCFFHLIDDKIVFAHKNLTRDDHVTTIKRLMYINEDGTFAEINNSGSYLKARASFDMSDFKKNARSYRGCWHETRFFYFYTIHNVYIDENTPSGSIPFLWTFEMEIQKWSEIILNMPIIEYGYRFGIDSDGFLSLIHYCLESDAFQECTSHLNRVALKNPDKLLNLCWFKIRKAGLCDKCSSLKILTDLVFH